MPTQKTLRPHLHDGGSTFTAAFAEEEIYPNDFVALSLTSPTSQGQVDGKDLLATDFIHCTKTHRLNTPGLQLGVAMGKGLDTVEDMLDTRDHAIQAGELVVIKTWGPHEVCWTSFAGNGTNGQAVYAHTTAGRFASGNLRKYNDYLGIGLGGNAANTASRATEDDAYYGSIFVRCHF